jgi:hypothetical protein
VSGAIDRLTGTASAFTFFISAREVRGNVQTQFTGGANFASLQNGRLVEAQGSLAGNVVTAERVTVNGSATQPGDDDDDRARDNDDDDDDVEFTGRIQSMTGTAPNLTLVVAGRTVTTSSVTVLRRRGNVVGFDALRINGAVEVEGGSRSNGVVLAHKITLEDDGDEGREVELSGAISGLSALSGCPSITFSLPAGSIFTTSATEFDDLRCSALTNGRVVEVKGFRESSGTIRARRIRPDR